MLIYTYGSIEILHPLINGISMLFKSGTIPLLGSLGAIVGLTLISFKSFMNVSLRPILREWLLPFFTVYALFFMPKVNVGLKDVITHQVRAVDDVPLGFAVVASLTTKLGHELTSLIETVMHVPGDLQYQKTGHIFGADEMLEASRYTINDPTLSQNMEQFVQNCVVPDFMMNRYNLRDFKSTEDILKYAEQHGSTLLGIYLKADEGPSTYRNCRQAARSLTEKLGPYVSRLAASETFKYLPFAYQALTGRSVEAQKLLQQQLMLNYVSRAVEAKGASLGVAQPFTVARARLQQQATLTTYGAMAGRHLVVVRGILEAVLMVSFLFMFPLIGLPSGLKSMMGWVKMMLWVNLWPPLYGVLSFILKTTAQKKAGSLFDLQGLALGGEGSGLSLATSNGLSHLYADYHAMAGWMCLVIPMIAYMLMSGSIQSFTHIAGNMMNASQSAVSQAAAEQVSGNYSFGNLQMDTISMNTQNSHKVSTSPSLSQGYYTEHTGSQTLTTTDQGMSFLDQKTSSLPMSVNLGESYTQNLNKAYQSSQQAMQTEQQNVQKGVEKASRHLADLTTHLSHNESATKGLSQNDQKSIQESADYIKGVAKRLSDTYNITDEEATQMTLGVGVGGKADGKGDTFLQKFNPLSASAEMSGKATNSKLLSELEDLSTNDQFQKHFQNMKQFSETKGHTLADEKGRRLTDSFNRSWGETESHMDSYQNAFSSTENYQKQLQQAESHSANLNENLSQPFLHYVADQLGSMKEAQQLFDQTQSGGSEASQQLNALAQDFIQAKVHTSPVLEAAPGNIRANYESHIKAKPSEGEREAFLKGVADKAGSFNDPSKVRKEIEEAQNKAERDISQNMHQVKGHFHTKMDKKDAEFKDKDGKWQTKRAFLNAWKVRRE